MVAFLEFLIKQNFKKTACGNTCYYILANRIATYPGGQPFLHNDYSHHVSQSKYTSLHMWTLNIEL